jgi:TPR repeat protein
MFEAIVNNEWPLDRVVIRVNWRRVAIAGLLAATVTILVALLVALGFQDTIERSLEPVSNGPSAATEVSIAPTTDSSSPLQVVVESAFQESDRRLPLGVLIRGPSELASTAAIEIIDLPTGWALSAGRPLGNRWRIPAAKLPGAAVLPPRGFSGAVDLEVELRLADDTLVERRSVHWAWAMTVPKLAPEQLAPEQLAPERLTPAKLAAENITLLLSKAEGLLVQGDFAGARLVLRRAAEAGNARAALLLGGTYEGCLNFNSLCNITDADRAAARYWYEMAAKFGSAEARQRLDRLGPEEPRSPRLDYAPGRTAAASAVDKVNPPVANTPPVDARSQDVKVRVIKITAVQEQDILSKAEGLLVMRDISAARLVLEQAAEAGNARAALLLGGTYEGCLFVPFYQFTCKERDRAQARHWYEMAAKFGSAEARQRLDRLAQ